MRDNRDRTAVADQGAWLQDSKDKVLRLAALPHGWDGFKAEPPTEEALCWADRVLGLLHNLDFRPDRIDASAEGGITLAFISGNRYADIECFNSGEILAATSNRIDEPDVWEVAASEASIRSTLERLRAYVLH